MNEDYAKGFVAAMIDGEGYVVAPNNRGQREVVVEMCDIEPIQKFQEALQVLGVRFRTRGRAAREGRRQTFAVSIASQQGLLALHRAVVLSIPEKQRRLSALLLTYKSQPYKLR